MAYIGNQPTVGNFVKLDAIVTSATTTFNLLNGGVSYTPASVLNMIVSLNGVIQEPTTASNVGGFTVSGSTIVFTSALTSLDVIDFILVLGDVLNIGTPSDGTVTFPKVTSNLITGATAEATIAGGDSVLIYDDSASALRKMTRTNFVAGVGGTNTPAFFAYHSTGQSISATTTTRINFANELFDTDSCYDPTTNYRFTPTTSGKYYLHTNLTFYRTTSVWDRGVVSIRKNGSNYAQYYISIADIMVSQDQTFVLSTIMDFNGSTDYTDVTFYCFDSNIYLDSNTYIKSYFFGYKLIGV
jgi:hypothetical protein